MSKLRSFRFPEEKLELLKEIAEREHDGNQTQAVLAALERYHQELNPPILRGYIQLDHVFDSGDEDCAGCDGPKGKAAWIAIYSNGSVKGILCDECVEDGRG